MNNEEKKVLFLQNVRLKEDEDNDQDINESGSLEFDDHLTYGTAY